MRFLCIYYDAKDGETKALVVEDVEDPTSIPEDLAEADIIDSDEDVHAVIGLRHDTHPSAVSKHGTLFVSCGLHSESTLAVPNAARLKGGS